MAWLQVAKYEEEISFQATKNGWKFYAVVIEVGARGWIPPSVFPDWVYTETFGKVLMQTTYTSRDQVKLYHLA